MFNQTFPDDCPIRVRTKLAGEGANNNRTSNSSRRLMPMTLAKPWFLGANATAAAAAANISTNHHNIHNAGNTGAAASSQRWAAKFNSHNAAADAEKPGVNKEDIKPMPYHEYHPIQVHQVQSDQELPIHYWFYVYLYSSDVDRLLTPFLKMVDSFGTDRRLTVIMNRCGVQILLKELELYKSLPRRIVVIKAAQWTSVVKALVEMEERLPELMRFATYPLLLDTDTTKFACTKFDRTACNNRLTNPIH